MKISYDAKADALNITFRETRVATRHLVEGVSADYDSSGRLIGLDILAAEKHFGREALQNVVVEGFAPEVVREKPPENLG
jgi:uncharacterized protein YuzE